MKNLSEMSREELAQDLQTALKHIEDLAFGMGCVWSFRFGLSRPEGETCREFKTHEQGVPSRGCSYCEGRAFLKQFGIVGEEVT